MKQSQKLRVIVNRIAFFSTVKQVREGVGDDSAVNAAVKFALDTLVDGIRRAQVAKDAKHMPSGISLITLNGYEVQVNVI